MSSKLSGKVCIITGTGGSMGRAAALAFAREGASVVGCDLNTDSAEATVQMVRREGGTMESLQPCRLSNAAECQALADFAVRRFGRVDVLFNNAAIDPGLGTRFVTYAVYWIRAYISQYLTHSLAEPRRERRPIQATREGPTRAQACRRCAKQWRRRRRAAGCPSRCLAGENALSGRTSRASRHVLGYRE
jgi:NAD(P)-dependent dehydrogenase (short-subunit alcohol dehydrogenase family)